MKPVIFPCVSVIVPVYNAERWLRCCVDSILAQTFTDFELLLIDDGSKDNSGAICDEYALKDSRVRVLHKENSGVSSARNVGLDNALGEWIAFVDADDYINRDYLEILIETVCRKNAEIVFCDFSMDFPTHQVSFSTYNWDKQGLDGLKDYICTPWTCLWGSLQRKELYDVYRLKSPERISYCEDFHLIVRLCYFAKKIIKVSQYLYHYRQQEDSVVHNLNKKTEADEMWVYTDIIEFFKKQNVYNEFRCVMGWRSIKATQELALNPLTINEFKTHNPDKRDCIFGCPFIGRKLQIIMWLFTHKMGIIAYSIIKLRKILGR